MPTITIDDEVARYIEESARRSPRQSVSEWVTKRVTPDADRAVTLAGIEAQAVANGYPPGWLAVYGSLADDDSFVAPVRAQADRRVEAMRRRSELGRTARYELLRMEIHELSPFGELE